MKFAFAIINISSDIFAFCESCERISNANEVNAKETGRTRMGTLAFVIRSLFVRPMCTHLNGRHANVHAVFDVVRYTGPLASQVHSPSARYSNSRHTFEPATRVDWAPLQGRRGRRISRGHNGSIAKVKRETREARQVSADVVPYTVILR